MLGGEDGQGENAQAEDPGERAADDHVVGWAISPERPEHDGDRDGRYEEAQLGVEPGDQRDERAGECDVPEGVAGEDLASQDQEVADQSGGGGDGRSCDQAVTDERLIPHVVQSDHRIQRTDHGRGTAASRPAVAWVALASR